MKRERMDTITKEDVKRLAMLARIAVCDEECEALAHDLDGLAALARTLEQLPHTTDCFDGTVSLDALREDTVEPSFSRDLLLQSAPKQDGEAVLVPRTVEE